MGMMALGILLVVLGLVLAVMNLFRLAELSAPVTWLGWPSLVIGIILALIDGVTSRRVTSRRVTDVVVEREYRRPGYP